MIYTCQNLVLVFHTSPLISAYLRLSPLISAISAYLRLSRIWGIFWGNLLIY